MVLFAVFFAAAGPVFAASAGDLVDKILAPVVNVTEKSRPIFDPAEADKQPQTQEADPFLKKVREKRARFEKDKLERRKKFLGKLREKNLNGEDHQQKLAAFHQKEMKKTQEFIRKQQKDMGKHFEKQKQ